MNIRCIAVDDEPLALEKMENYIQRVDYLELTGSFDNAFAALSFLRKHDVDLIFLDIQMDEFTGIQFLEVLGKKPKVILTTAYDQYALKGYELDVIDYLLKPIGFQRFLTAADKAWEQIRQLYHPQDNADLGHILVRSEYRLQKIVLNEVLYIEGMKDYSRIFTHDNKVMTLQNLKRLEEVLPCPPFMRIHKSYIVSLNSIDSIGKNDVTIGAQNIPIGGLYKQAFLDYLENQHLIG